MNSNECFICLDDLEESYKINKECKCILDVHEKCLFKWLSRNKQCPICRTIINIPDKEIIINVPENAQIPILHDTFLTRYMNKIISLIFLVILISIVMALCF